MSRGMQIQHRKRGGVMRGERRQSQSKIKGCRIKLNKYSQLKLQPRFFSLLYLMGRNATIWRYATILAEESFSPSTLSSQTKP
jgi:hypothetical protein